MGIIEVLTMGVAAVAVLALAHAMNRQRHPIRKEARIEEHERTSYRKHARHQ